MEEEEKNEWGLAGQPSASEQLKKSGYTEGINYEQIIDDEYAFPRFSEDPTEQNRLNVRHAYKKFVNQMQLSETERNLLINNGFPSDMFTGGNAAPSPLVDTALIAAPFLAKPALLKGAITGAGKLIRKYPMKTLDVALTALGGASEDPQDIAMETTAFKADTLFSGPNPIRMGKNLQRIFDDVFSNSVFNRYAAANDVPNVFKIEGTDDIIPSGDARSIDPTKGGITPKGGGDPKGIRSQQKYLQGEDLWANLPTQTKNKLNELGFTHEDNIFVIDKYKSISREEAAVIENLWSTTSDFEKVKEAALPYFFESMKGVDITKKPNLDHIAQLKASLGFFNGQPIKKWPMISDIIVKEGVYGLGHDAKNLEFLDFDVHVAKTNWWNDMVGPAGEKFFKNPDGSWKIFTNDEDLKEAAGNYAKLIRQSDEIVGIANDQFKLMNSNAEMPESVFNAIMQRVTTNPYKYNIKKVKLILDEIAKDKTTLAGFDYNMRKDLLPKGFKKELDKLSNFIRATENGLAIILDIADGKLLNELNAELTQLEFRELSKIVKNKSIKAKIEATYGPPITRHKKRGRAKPIDPAKGQVGSSVDPFDDTPDDFIDPYWNEMTKKK